MVLLLKVRRRHKRIPRDDPQDVRRQLDDEAHQRRHLHLQPAHRTTLPQDHPHQRVGGTEASRTGALKLGVIWILDTLLSYLVFNRVFNSKKNYSIIN